MYDTTDKNMKPHSGKGRAIQVRIADQGQDLASEMVRAHETLATLRIEIRTVLTKYRMWRAHMRCGRAFDSDVELFNMPMVKKIRGLWATYRFAQMVRADIQYMMALEEDARRKLDEIDSMTHFGFKPEMVSFEELEGRYGSAIAQNLYDDMLMQTARDVKKRKLVS